MNKITLSLLAILISAQVSAESILDIGDKIRKYRATYPDATKQQLDDYARSLVGQSSSKEVAKTATTARVATLSVIPDIPDYEDVAEVVGDLNPQEKALYDSDPAKSLLCLANGKLALDYTKQKYTLEARHNGNGDAFRHALWTFGMAVDVGLPFAIQWSNAHEYGATKQPELERKMDLHNNQIGLSLAVQNPYTMFHSSFINIAQAKVRAGDLLRIKNDKLVWTNSEGELK